VKTTKVKAKSVVSVEEIELTNKDALKIESFAKEVKQLALETQESPSVSKRLLNSAKHLHNTALIIEKGNESIARLKKRKEKILERKKKLEEQLTKLEEMEE